MYDMLEFHYDCEQQLSWNYIKFWSDSVLLGCQRSLPSSDLKVIMKDKTLKYQWKCGKRNFINKWENNKVWEGYKQLDTGLKKHNASKNKNIIDTPLCYHF